MTTIIPNSEVRLCSNVPLNNRYEHTMTFANATDQANYFLAKVSHAYTGLTYQRESMAVRVPTSYDSLYNCNYLMYRNNDFGTKWFYAFITKREYVNPEMTLVHFELDVFQTWQFDLTWKPSFVEREHRTRWNVDGTPVINTVEEDLNYGSEYTVVSAEHYRPADNIYFLVACCKKTMHAGLNQFYYASLNGVPQLLVYYVHPFRLDGSTPACSLGAISDVSDFLAALYTQDSAVDNIVSLYVTDVLPTNPIYANDSLSFDSNYYQKVDLAQQLNGAAVSTVFVTDVSYGTWIYDSGDKYVGYTEQTESKLLMYPYTVLELTDLRGNKAIFKNEYIKGNNLVLTVMPSLGVSQKTVYTLADYLMTITGDSNTETKVSLEHALINTDPNDLPILTDLLAAYLQGNRNQIQNQKNAVAWNGAMGAVSAGMGAMTHSMMAAPMAAEGIQNVGNAYYQMRGIVAKQQDISHQPPNMAKMGSNSYFDFGYGLTGVWIIKKEITPEYQKKLSDYFKMYGYKINEVKVPNLNTRQHFNFVKTVGANIFGNIPIEDLDKLREMFNNGVTLWHGDWVCDYSLANSEV